MLAGISIGALGVAIGQISDGHVFGPLTILRATEALLIGAIVLVGHRAWRPNRRLWPALASVFLQERVTRTHATGIALAIASIACIAAGSS